MDVKEKYDGVVKLARSLNIENERLEERDGKFYFAGDIDSQMDKDKIWNKIKEIGGTQPNDATVDLNIKNTQYYGKYTVQKGDTLSHISKDFLGNANDYNKIFEANRDQLSDPNKIQIGQELTIPNR